MIFPQIKLYMEHYNEFFIQNIQNQTKVINFKLNKSKIENFLNHFLLKHPFTLYFHQLLNEYLLKFA